MTELTSPQRGHLAPHNDKVREVQFTPAAPTLTSAGTDSREPGHPTETTVARQTASKQEAHSFEIEVLETNVQTPEKCIRQSWELQIVINEGIIVV